MKPVHGELPDGIRPAAGSKAFSRFQAEDNAGVRRVKFLHADPDPAPGGIVQEGAFLIKPLQHHEVIVIPVDDRRKLHLLPQGRDAVFVDMHFHPVPDRGLGDIGEPGAVPGYAAVLPHLLKRQAVIRQHHRQGRRAALRGLHLHDYGDVLTLFHAYLPRFN